MPLSRRYTPEHPPGEECFFGLDYSFLIPPGVGIASATVEIWTNTPGDVQPSQDWTLETPVHIEGRTVFAKLTGGIEGTDYQIRWIVTDTRGNIWPRTALVLCAQTS
jgi:hypothetical protein